MKMTGQSLNGRYLILKPVKIEIRDITTSIQITAINTVVEIIEVLSRRAVNSVRIPRNIRVTPSVIHSMVMILRLSVDMSPKFLTTLLVGMRWAIPQIIFSVAEQIRTSGFNCSNFWFVINLTQAF